MRYIEANGGPREVRQRLLKGGQLITMKLRWEEA